jgi:Uma2 family endonuclease
METETGVEGPREVMGRERATYADLEALPEHVVGEIIGGELHVSPRPAIHHTLAASVLSSKLGGAFFLRRGIPGGWIFLNKVELHLGEDVLVPDTAGWRRERMPRTPHTVGFTLAPDWVCEVLSPSTARLDRKAKLPVYAREGVQHVWFVDPEARTLEVFRLDGAHYAPRATHTGMARVRAEPFEALELELAALWDEV